MSREKPRQVDDKPLGAGISAPPEQEEPPARAAAYIPPMAVPKESRYHTIDMKAVRLSPDIDPQRMKTQLSLRAVQAVTEQKKSTVPAWIVLLLVGGALGTCVWWFARWRNVTEAVPVVSVLTTPSVPAVPAPPPSAAPAAPVAPASVAPLAPAEASAAVTAAASAEVVTPPVVPASKPAVAVAPRAPAKAVSPRASVASRKVNTSPAPATDGPQPASSQPKLWLE